MNKYTNLEFVNILRKEVDLATDWSTAQKNYTYNILKCNIYSIAIQIFIIHTLPTLNNKNDKKYYPCLNYSVSSNNLSEAFVSLNSSLVSASFTFLNEADYVEITNFVTMEAVFLSLYYSFRFRRGGLSKSGTQMPLMALYFFIPICFRILNIDFIGEEYKCF